jgi:hypothetical protein
MTIDLCHPFHFYDRQLMAASEREVRDGDATMADSGNNNPASMQGGISTALDPDGEMVAWGSAASDMGTDPRYVSDPDGEYKPANHFFNR